MNTLYFIVQQTMFFAIPLMIVALGALYSERSGVTNIALEGIMIIGAFTGVCIIKSNLVSNGQLLFIIAIAAAALVGMLFSLFHAWASVKMMADQTVSGTAINIFVPALCIFISRTLFGSKQMGFSEAFFISKVPVLGDIPVIGKLFFTNCYLSTYIGIVLLLILATVLSKTRFGMRLSACGENPEAAASSGVSVGTIRYLGVLISGLLGGAGGLVFVVTTSTSFSSNVSGYGFLALAVLIMGQWKPILVMAAAFAFGFLKSVSSSYSGIPVLADLPISAEIYKMIPYILTIVVLIVSSSNSNSPKSLGKPFDVYSGKKSKKVFPKVIRAVAVVMAVIIGLNFATGQMLKANDKTRSASDGFGADIGVIVSSSASIDDKSYTQSIWEGVCKYTSNKTVTRKYYQSKDNSYESFVNTADLAVLGNADTIIYCGNEFDTAVYRMQKDRPDLRMILIDSLPHSKENGEAFIGQNTLCISYAEEEAGFFAGYAAVKDGYRNIGFIGGLAVPAVVRYGYGFLCGAEYAANELNLGENSIIARYNYAGAFTATPEVLSMASSWYQNNTEVIFACGGALGNSVMKAAETNGKYVIGVDIDQSYESNTVITSAMKKIDGSLTDVLDGFRNGKITGGKELHLTSKENAVGLPMETSRFKKFTKEDYDNIGKKLSENQIEVWKDTDAETPDLLNLYSVKLLYVS